MRRDMPGRLLQLLSLLQSRREWSGGELAARLDISDRTLRRDVERLRRLDYPVRGTTGTAGGYRLASGRNLPPLQLDDDEALAVAIGLVGAAGSGVSGVDDAAMGALAKLQRVLPARLRPRLAALSGTAAVVPYPDTPATDPSVLAVLAACARDGELVTFAFRDGIRRVEPHHLVTMRGFWYLVAYDPDRADWRTFRVDRIDEPRPTHRGFARRELPVADPAEYLTSSFVAASFRHTAFVTIALPAERVRAETRTLLPRGVDISGCDPCTVRFSADSPALLAQFVAVVAGLGATLRIEAPAEVRARLRDLASQLLGGLDAQQPETEDEHP